MTRIGRDAIVHVARYLSAEIRHHRHERKIDVSADAREARLSAYYLHVHAGGISGGVYQGGFRLEADGYWPCRPLAGHCWLGPANQRRWIQLFPERTRTNVGGGGVGSVGIRTAGVTIV